MLTAVLMVKDEELESRIGEVLSENGYEIQKIKTFDDLRRYMPEGEVHVVVLEDAYLDRPFQEIVRRFRENFDVPLLAVSRDNDEISCILALELGADDYMRGPVNMRELAVRCRNLSDRRIRLKKDYDRIIQVGDIKIRPSAHAVYVNNQAVPVSNMEYQILEEMLRTPGVPVSRRVLFDKILGRGYNRDDRSVDMHISSLRKKLGLHSDGTERIKAFRGVGYFYVPGGDD